MYIENYIDPKPRRSLLYGEKSIGIVVKTPEELEKDNVVGVYIPRFMFGLDNKQGAYEENKSVTTDKILNSKNTSIGSKKFKSKNYLTLPIAQSGCVNSPRLVKGENVFIECCDRDIKNCYVLPFSLGDQSRRKDDVYTILIPNFKEWGESPTLNLENTYGLQIDTRSKILSLWTTCEGGGETGDNEKGKYMISINPKEGKVHISDNGKRTWTLNTEEDSITEQNEAGCKIQMIDDTINMYAPSTINIEADDEINIKSSKLNRDHEDIVTSASTDTENVDTLDLNGKEGKSGKEINVKYDNISLDSKSYENKTNKWKTDSPISGFTKVLTANSFNIWSNAGNNPPSTTPTFDSSGKLKAGNPSVASLPVTLFMPTEIALQALATAIDGIGAHVGVPPSASAAVTAWKAAAKSKYVFG